MGRLDNGRHAIAAAAIAVALAGCFTGPAPDPAAAASAGTPTLVLSSGALAFVAPAGSGDPAPQILTATDGGAGALAAPTTQIAYQGASGGWLAASVAGSGPSYDITVQAAVGAMPPGTYAATLDVAAAGAANSPQSVPVTLTVGSASQPTMALSAASLSFTSIAGAPPPPQTVTVSNAGTGSLAPPTPSTSYLGADKGWLTVTVSGAAAPYTITVQPDVSGLTPRSGAEKATISVDCAGASNTPLAIAVQLTLR
jgi:hypothetical protein